MKRQALFFLLLCFGCGHRKAPAVHISLVNNNQSIQFKGLDPAIMGEVTRNASPGVWENLIPVYRMPADTDLKDYQPIQPGNYQVKDNVIVFTPDTPFTKGHTYFMRYYQFEGGTRPWDFIGGRKRLGSVSHQDLVFRD
ncbi:hypothetical protein [Mucilaginibacter sp.]|uniref:hypothetical protein n=1 Tax=Mucilaginibacter sp. TaxID=1882438 RepID=UPI00283E8D37|nr:hypothetical protein [Mucilaginibacter sp.]MDR3695539.1 hypothetical protein [Mucilaginibacter sp.]